MTVHRSDHNLPMSLQESLDVDHNCPNTPWKNEHDGCRKIRLCYLVSEIYPISLLEGEIWNNEDYSINSTDLVTTCNDSLLMYFFDHDDENDNASFSLFTVSNVIIDCDYNYRLCYTNKKKRAPKTTLKVVTLLINTSPVISVTEKDIDPSPVPVQLASDDAASTNSYLIKTWSMKFLLKQLLDSTTFADHTTNCQTHPTFIAMEDRNKCEPKLNLRVVQVKKYTVDSYYPILTSYSHQTPA